MSFGLAEIPTRVLERLLAELRAGSLAPPWTDTTLRMRGLGALSRLADPLGQLDSSSLSLLLEAVLAERRRSVDAHPELVWTGPEPRVSGARDTAVVVRDLFSSAQRSVLVAGFRFDSGQNLLEPLHQAMKDRGVRCDLFGDAADLASFRQRNWPFGDPFPRLYRDAREEPFTSLHAKCIVVDEERAFVTSANFTDRGQERNIEVGVLLFDTQFAQTLATQWHRATSTGLFRPLSD